MARHDGPDAGQSSVFWQAQFLEATDAESFFCSTSIDTKGGTSITMVQATNRNECIVFVLHCRGNMLNCVDVFRL